jgi:hypothetical protein
VCVGVLSYIHYNLYMTYFYVKTAVPIVHSTQYTTVQSAGSWKLRLVTLGDTRHAVALIYIPTYVYIRSLREIPMPAQLQLAAASGRWEVFSSQLQRRQWCLAAHYTCTLGRVVVALISRIHSSSSSSIYSAIRAVRELYAA